MGRGAPQKWSDAQIAAVRAEALKGTSARELHRRLKAGQVPGYFGEVMPVGTVTYHHGQARRKALETARAEFQPDAIRLQAGGILASMLKDAEIGATKARRELRAGKAGCWETLERAAKAIEALARASDRLNGPATGPKTPRQPATPSEDRPKSTDLVTQLAATTDTQNDAQTR